MKTSICRYFILLLFYGSLLVNTSAAEESGYIQELLNALPTSKEKMVKSILDFLPAEKKVGITNYLNMIGVNVQGSQNVGLAKFNQKLLEESSCFEELAAQFYASIHQEVMSDSLQILLTRLQQGSYKNSVNSPINANLNDLKKKPGWLWSKALAFSKGDSLLAIQLIGLCGHDDTMQFPENFYLGKKSLSKEWKDKIRAQLDSPEIKEKIRLISQEAQSKKVEDSYLSNYIFVSLMTHRYDLKNGVLCPDPASSFYFPKALGEDADISPQLKDKIVRLQAPTMGPQAIKSKSYHIMGAVVTSCQLIQRGIPDFVSEKIIKGAINAYRSSRLCKILIKSSSYKGPRELTIIHEMILHKREDLLRCFREEKKIDGTGATYSSFSVVPPSIQTPNNNLCSISSLLPYELWKDSDATGEILLKKIKRKLAEIDTQDLFLASENFIDAKKCQGPQLSDSVREYMEKYGSEGPSNPCPATWTKERCQSARAVMASYAVDFEWSERQQLTGYNFSKQHCPRYDSTKTIETMSCKALGKQPNGTPKINTSSPSTQ